MSAQNEKPAPGPVAQRFTAQPESPELREFLGELSTGAAAPDDAHKPYSSQSTCVVSRHASAAQDAASARSEGRISVVHVAPSPTERATKNAAFGARSAAHPYNAPFA